MGTFLKALEDIGGFLLEHKELVSLLKNAIDQGVQPSTLHDSIKAAMITASDEQMKKELGA